MLSVHFMYFTVVRVQQGLTFNTCAKKYALVSLLGVIKMISSTFSVKSSLQRHGWLWSSTTLKSQNNQHDIFNTTSYTKMANNPATSSIAWQTLYFCQQTSAKKMGNCKCPTSNRTRYMSNHRCDFKVSVILYSCLELLQ